MNADNCGICLESLQDGRPVRELHSGPDWSHIFHDQCIRSWINSCVGQGRSIECPMCRAPLNAENLRAIPESFWDPVKIVFAASELVFPGLILRQMYITYHEWLEFNRLEELDNLAFRNYARSSLLLSSSMSNGGERPLLSTGHQNFNTFLTSSLRNNFNQSRAVYRGAIRNSMNSLHATRSKFLSNMFALLLIMSVLNYVKMRARRGGGNEKSICINDVCIGVPEDSMCTVQEAFDNLKNELSKINKVGGKTRKRRY